MEKNFTIVQIVLMNDTGDSYHRMRWPAAQLASQDPELRIINLDASAKERFSWGLEADLLVVFQSHDVDLLPVLLRRKAAGKKTLVEYNDNFYAPQPWSPVAKEWNTPQLRRIYESFMVLSDGIIVTGPGLQELFSSRFRNEVLTLENHLPYAPAAFETLWPDPSKELIIGWAGSLGHIADFLSLMPTLRKFVLSHPQSKLHLMGNETLPNLTQLPAERVLFQPWGGMNDYFSFIKRFHLGLAPLLDTPYNRCRSDIKALEYASCGVLPLLSRALPYQAIIQALSLPSYRDFRELFDLLDLYSRDNTRLETDARRAYDYVAQNRVGQLRRERLEVYKRFLPPTPSEFSWPFPLGYHETDGSKEEKSLQHTLLEEAQTKLKGGEDAGALAIIEKRLSENPLSADLWLALAKCLARGPGEHFLSTLSKAQERFPDDLRFSLLRLRIVAAADGSAWGQLLRVLQTFSQTERRFYEDETSLLLAQALRQHPQLFSLSESFLTLYPDNAPLRLSLAEAAERLGKYDLALSHYRWLRKQREIVLSGSSLLSTLDLGYLRAWEETLEARLRGS